MAPVDINTAIVIVGCAFGLGGLIVGGIGLWSARGIGRSLEEPGRRASQEYEQRSRGSEKK